MHTLKASRRFQLFTGLKAFASEQGNQPSKVISVNQGSTTALGKLLNRRYQVTRILGTGGFSQTYLAKDIYKPSNPTCVVKHFKPASSDPSFLQTAQVLFQAEAEILEKLGHHSQIPQLLAYFEEEQDFYLVQEYIDGLPLSAEMPPGKCWTETQVIQMLQEVLDLLEFIHSQGVIHRDIKPDNLIRRKQDNKLVLIDFGTVKQIRTQTVTDQNRRHATIPVGTPGYMAPEQGQGNPRPNSDLYALGIISIQALTGLDPRQFQEDPNTGEFCWQQQAKVSSELASFISNLVSYHFKDRYQVASKALEALLQLTKTEARPSVPIGRTLTNQPSNSPTHSFNHVETSSQQLSTPSILLPQVPDSEPSQKVVFAINPSEQPTDAKNKSWLWAGIGTGLASAVALSAGISSMPDSSMQNVPNQVAVKPGNSNLVKPEKNKLPDQPQLANPTNTLAQQRQLVKTITDPLAQKLEAIADTNNLLGEKLEAIADTNNLLNEKLEAIATPTSLPVKAPESIAAPVHSPVKKQEIATPTHSPDQKLKEIRTTTNRVTEKLEEITNSTNRLAQRIEAIPALAKPLVQKPKVVATPAKPLVESEKSDESAKEWKRRVMMVRSHPPLEESEVLATPTNPTKRKHLLASLRAARKSARVTTTADDALTSNSNNAHSPIISPDGQFLIGISTNNTIKIWNLHTGELLNTLSGHSSPVRSVAINPDGQTLTSTSTDNTIKTWNLHTGELLHTFTSS